MDNDLMATEQRHSVAELEDLAFELRSKLLQLCGTYEGAVHIGGDLSSADIFTALFHYGLHVDPTDIRNPTRDRFLLSKGHAAVCMYIAMSMRGFFSYEGIVDTYGQLDSAYGMHPCKVQLPGVEAPRARSVTVCPLAVGMALSARGRGETHRVVRLLGDGETGEGSVWEAAMAATQQQARQPRRLHRPQPSADDELRRGARRASSRTPTSGRRSAGTSSTSTDTTWRRSSRRSTRCPLTDSDRPTVVICETVKGKGVDFMERNLAWHAGSLGAADLERAMAALDASRVKEIV